MDCARIRSSRIILVLAGSLMVAAAQGVSASAATVPSAPTLSWINGPSQVSLNWSAPTNDGGSAITGYSIARGTIYTVAPLVPPYATVGPATTSYVDTAVTPRTVYYYMVAAQNAVGTGAWSSTISATPYLFVPGHCYSTGAGTLEVCHDYTAAAQQGQYFQTPADEIAYNLQRVQVGSQVHTVYHSEAKKSHDPGCTATWCLDGDSLKVASSNDLHMMPATRSYVQWGQYADSTKNNYYGPPDGVGGAGNPMTIAGLAGDPYYYTYSLGSGNWGADPPGTYRIYLQLARTTDFVTWQVLARTTAGQQWLAESDAVDPVQIQDVAGNLLRSNNAMSVSDVQGLLGSISYVNGLYYYFYTDYVPGTSSAGGQTMQLYYRTAGDISHDGAWSSPAPVFPTQLSITLARVAKDFGNNRWVILYNCLRVDQGGNQDLCLQYTENLNVTGAGGLSSLNLYDFVQNGAGYSADYLGLSATSENYSQHDFLTDVYGNLPNATPDVTWSDFSKGVKGVYGAPVYWATANVLSGQQAAMARAGDAVVMTGEVYSNQLAGLKQSCSPPQGDPACYRFDLSVSGSLAPSGILHTWFYGEQWGQASATDYWTVTAYNSAGGLLGSVDHVGTQCNLITALSGFRIQGQSLCPPGSVAGPSPLNVPLSGTSDGRVVLVVLPRVSSHTSTFRLEMQLQSQ